ncbi:MAG: MFS transporter [Clostridia bacterium]|nr:MFS transporter [Clostridia bacterium]
MSKKHFFGFAALQVSYWCFHASFICYASAFFLENGIGSAVVSLLLAGYMLCSFLGSIVWGAVCDALGTNKKVFILGLCVSAALLGFIYAFGSNVMLMAVAYPLLGFFFLPQSANSEAWLLSACHHDQKVYGQIRSTPSMAYAVWAALMGRLIDVQGYWVMLAGAAAFFAAVISAALVLPDAVPAKRSAQNKITRRDIAALAANKAYRRLIMLLFLVGLAIAPINNLKIIVLESVGGTVAHVGLDSFASALTQVPFIMLAGWLARIPLRARYTVMTAGPFVMILMCLFAVSPAMVIAGSVAYNTAYGVLLPTMREVTEKNVQENLRNLGHSLSDAVFTSFSGVISLIYAGAVVDGFGVQAMMMISMVIAAAALLVGLLSGRGE